MIGFLVTAVLRTDNRALSLNHPKRTLLGRIYAAYVKRLIGTQTSYAHTLCWVYTRCVARGIKLITLEILVTM